MTITKPVLGMGTKYQGWVIFSCSESTFIGTNTSTEYWYRYQNEYQVFVPIPEVSIRLRLVKKVDTSDNTTAVPLTIWLNLFLCCSNLCRPPCFRKVCCQEKKSKHPIVFFHYSLLALGSTGMSLLNTICTQARLSMALTVAYSYFP